MTFIKETKEKLVEGGGGLKYMHKDNVRKKTCIVLSLPKILRLIYIIYVNLGKTGFVERSRNF